MTFNGRHVEITSSLTVRNCTMRGGGAKRKQGYFRGTNFNYGNLIQK